MGSGRDKRKKHEDPAKAAKRAVRQSAKSNRGKKGEEEGEGAGGEGENPFEDGFNNEESIEVTLKKLRKSEGKKMSTIERENVPPPSPRANVVFVVHPMKEQELVVFGGELWNGVSTVAYNDLFLYNTVKQRWTQVEAPVNPSPRSSAQGIVYKQFLFVHGGEFVSQTQSQFLHFKDVWRFDFRTMQWDEMKSLKGGPSSRSGHRMCLWKRQAVVFGGFYDNAQECRYFNDLWILADLEANGRWRPVTFPTHNEPPHPRSGHAAGVYQDTLFIYGGYSSQKFNRFKKSEATVHHDLWSTNLAAEQPVWTRIRLGGIPPPIRAGVGATTRDKQLLLFGGVVDIEAPGGKMVSTFHNDLFSFHMDSQRFYPLTLQAPKKKSTETRRDDGGAAPSAKTTTLEAELAALNLKAGAAKKDDVSSSDEDDDDDDLDEALPLPAEEKERFSFETTRLGQVIPHRRMDAALCAVGHTVYMFGGQLESGKKEITITDLFSLNLNTRETWTTYCAQNMQESVWAGRDDTNSDAANSWESGSTVLSGVMFGDHGDGSDEEEEEDDDKAHHHRDPHEALHDDTPAELDQHITPSVDEIGGGAATAGGRLMGGKRGMQAHKAQLVAQLGSGSVVPTPTAGETLSDFFRRTEDFWMKTAAECLFGLATIEDVDGLGAKDARRCRSEALSYCRTRHDEAIVLMEQLRIVEEREKEEAEFFKKLRAEKEKVWEQSEADARAAGEDDDDAPTLVPKKDVDTALPKGALKSALKKQAVDNSDDDDDDDDDDESNTDDDDA
ncbi:Hypothetical protein, putative [Bodo saltans]|uniref:DUF4110 domain-containing protein n=1 Tax=Bodo saltans TaxID=75058 RepID=A0A0S4JR73_BODSA|nr:Hypothetical protein, putative [Bodo saltans]|eukprot:CUG92685.1 Hypothetical protein, putative [Bodo saltans]